MTVSWIAKKYNSVKPIFRWRLLLQILTGGNASIRLTLVLGLTVLILAAIRFKRHMFDSNPKTGFGLVSDA